MSRRRDRLIQDSRSLPFDAASRALRGDAAGTAAAHARSSGPLATEIAEMFERAGPLVRGASEVLAWELEEIAAQGEKCLKRGEVGEAVAVFSTLGAGICSGYEAIWDEESEVGMVLDRCVDGLEACLDRAEPSARGEILGAFLDIAVWERTSGGYGIGERAAELVLARSTANERRAIAAAAAAVLQQAVLRAYASASGASSSSSAAVRRSSAARCYRGRATSTNGSRDCSRCTSRRRRPRCWRSSMIRAS